MKTFAIILIVLVVAAAAIAAYATTLPDDFRVARTKHVNAPPEAIFPLISDLRKLNEWNPFAKHDPSIKIEYSGAANGAGSAYSWGSDGKAGNGRLSITDASAPSTVAMKLDMERPMEAHHDILFTVQPSEGGSDVTWAMSGKAPFISKMVSVFCSMDRMIGGEFEKGLNDLKTIAEK